jgi:hypothetical protein
VPSPLAPSSGPATNHNFLILIYPNTKQRARPTATSASPQFRSFVLPKPPQLPASVRRPAREDETSTSGFVPDTVLIALSGTLSAFQIPSLPPPTAASCTRCSGFVPHPSGRFDGVAENVSMSLMRLSYA